MVVSRAKELLSQNLPFSKVNEILVEEFHSGLSMSTLTSLNQSKSVGPQGDDLKRVEAGKELYQIFTVHFKEIKKLLSPEEREKMNEIAEVLENA